MTTGPQHQVIKLAGKCPTCDSYVRKIEQVERTLSGRDAVITVLHSRVQTFENDYKNLLSQFETLRFEHSAALQDNFSLSEINAKLEEIYRCSNADTCNINSLDKPPEHLCKASATENTNYICCQEVEVHSTDSTTDFLDIKLKQLASDIYNLVMSQDRHSPNPEMVNMLHKTQQFQQCCCQLIDQLNDAQDNNQALSETLNVVTTENKTNLETINELKKELRRTTEGYEKEMEKLKGKVTKLEDNLDETNSQKRKLEQIIDGMQEDMKGLKNRLKLLINENDKLQACACEVQHNEEQLRLELNRKSLKLTECAEENSNLCQRIEMLDKYNAELVGDVRKLQNQLQQQTNKQECKEHAADEDCTNLKCRKTQIDALEKLDEVEVLKNEMQKHLDEKQQLRKEVERVNSENHKEIERLQGLVEHFQKQVEMLIAEHDEKTCQIKSVASELEAIRKNVTEDKDSYLEQIKKLESERDEAKRQMLELACECDRGQCELDKMKQELAKKECIIQELEKSVDQFNDTLKNFDQTVEKITNENARLKTEKDNLAKDLKLKESHDDVLKENENLKRTVEQLQLDTCQLQIEVETLSRESGASGKLRQAYDELKKMFDTTSKELEELKEKCRECSRLRKEMEQENVKWQEENRDLKQTAEALKGECDRLQRDRALKCMEMESLKVSVEQKKQDQITKMRCQIEEKCAEMKKMRKQLDLFNKQSQITHDEYTNLRKEYKEIKSMMSEQVKTYKLTQLNNGSNQTPVTEQLKQNLAEKDEEIATLHTKLRDASFEMIELKDQISKVVDDNNVLKNSINGLISNLERKIRGPSFTSLPSNSTEIIAGEILNSLANIEEIITKNGDCPGRCCDCMSEIQSQYSFQDNIAKTEKLCTSPCHCQQFLPPCQVSSGLSTQFSNYQSNNLNFTSSLDPTNKAPGFTTTDSDDIKLFSIKSESDLQSK